MSDEALRELERTAEGGSPSDQAALLISRLRSGSLPRAWVEIAVWCGDEAAFLALEEFGSDKHEFLSGPSNSSWHQIRMRLIKESEKSFPAWLQSMRDAKLLSAEEWFGGLCTWTSAPFRAPLRAIVSVARLAMAGPWRSISAARDIRLDFLEDALVAPVEDPLAHRTAAHVFALGSLAKAAKRRYQRYHSSAELDAFMAACEALNPGDALSAAKADLVAAAHAAAWEGARGR